LEPVEKALDILLNVHMKHMLLLEEYSLPGYFTITLADDRNYLSVELTKQLQ
jgi:hypothetical protein